MIEFQKFWCTHRICNNCDTEEGIRDIEEAVEFYQFADWLNENLEFKEL